MTFDNEKVTADGSAKNTLVRVESELLPTVGTRGIKSGPGFIELAPGQSVSLFCDDTLGIVGALCSEISVRQPKETKLADGGLRLESAAVVIHLFKKLDNLVPGVKLASLLGDADLEGLAAPVTGLQGLTLGERTDVPGIKLVIAQTSAQTSGRRVLGRAEEAVRAGPEIDTGKEAGKELPHTGGLPRAMVAVPALLGASAALRLLIRRWPSP